MDFAALKAEFPREAVSWRAQSLTRDGSKAMALAYIGARDVMNRLDDVCGPAGWQVSYVETPLGRVIATISIDVGGAWVSKADGAGKTDIEGDKGGISDAFKRAAVQWGIGRYLYDIVSPWVPCETSEYNGKKSWKAWTVDPWTCVKGAARPAPANDRKAAKSDPAAKVTDAQRDWLAGHAEKSVGVADLCRHYGKNTLKDFTVGELEPARDWLKSQQKAA